MCATPSAPAGSHSLLTAVNVARAGTRFDGSVTLPPPKRYREFFALRSSLIKAARPGVEQLPFPSRKVRRQTSTSQNTVDTRQSQLETWLNAVLVTCACDPQVLEFLSDEPGRGGKPGKQDGRPAVERTDSQLRTLFDEHDDNGNGMLDRDEVRGLVEELRGSSEHDKPEPVTDEQLEEMMALMDADGSGSVCFVEFKDWWRQTTAWSGLLANGRGSARGA